MIRSHSALRLAGVAAVCAFASEASAQPGNAAAEAPAPAPAAQDLAAALVGAVPQEHVAAGLESQLLNSHAAWRGAPCDPEAPACAAAARAVARDYAAREAAGIRQALIRLYAQRLAARMSEAEMQAALDHLGTPGGEAFARGLRSLLTIEPGYFHELVTGISVGAVGGRRGAIDAFYDRTEGLPRRVDRHPAPPPPPSPGPPPRRP